MKQLRLRQKLNQATLAKRVGVTQPYIVALEKGRENPTLSILTKLANGLGVGIESLFLTGSTAMAKLNPQDQKWNAEVAEIAKKLETVEKWALNLEKRGERDEDWYSERRARRLAGLLHQAIAEAYDLQFFSNDRGISNWRKAQHID